MFPLLRLNRWRAAALALALGLVFAAGGAGTAWAWTQSGVNIVFANPIPMGHEWMARMAAIELLGYTPATVPDVPDPKDPRKGWTQGLARNTDLSSPGAQAEMRRLKAQAWNDLRYASRYKAVYDAIVGERWVDLAGYNAATSRECWDAVAQEPAEVQYDHFMRRYDERDAQGGVNAAKNSQQRFVDYFIAAATAPATLISVYDGGAQASTAVEVDRNYFLFGRAMHLFQDAFSTEHTVRVPADNYVRVRQVKSYLCASGSEQHTHSQSEVLKYTSGDVVWKPGTQLDPSWKAYKASSMKDFALVATEATKDLWAAFIRTMGAPADQRAAVARAEATALVNNWLSYDENEMKAWYASEANRDGSYVLAQGQAGKGKTVQQCMKDLGVGTDDQMTHVRKLEASQRKCAYNAIPWVGYSDLFDTSQHIWFAWRWRNGPTGALLDPPPDWQIPNLPADSGVRVRIKSVANNQYMSAPDGIQHNAWVYCRAGATPLDFIMVGPKDDGVFRVANAPWLFLSYTNATGSVKLFNPYTMALDPTNYKIARAGPGWSIKSIYWQQHMWLSNESPYITRTGDPAKPHSQWYIDGLPVPAPRWEQMPGPAGATLKQISAGSANAIWGLDTNGNNWKWNGTAWEKKGCCVSQISVTADGTLWATNPPDQMRVLRWSGTAWTSDFPTGMKQVAGIDANNTWGLGNDGAHYRLNGRAWDKKGCCVSQISAGADGELWATNPPDGLRVLRWSGTAWTWAIPTGMVYVAAGSAGNIWALDGSDKIYRWSGSAWTPENGALRQITAAGDGTVWGVNAEGAVYRYVTP